MRKRRLVLLPLVAVIALSALAADDCNEKNGVTTASCAFIVGDGSTGHDAKLHKVVLPGQTFDPSANEKVSYVPCNSRNYIINDGTVKNPNGEIVGDRFNMITATTKSGVEIYISATALWTLNQTEASLRDFYNVCFKYQCASSKDVGGDINSSTKGWNSMLAENFGPTMDKIAQEAAAKLDDSVWKTHDQGQVKSLEDSMSALFADRIRARLGYAEDLFCGSGNSVWSDPNKPGSGTFNCSPVRIVVEEVRRGQVNADASSQGVLEINAQRLKNAQALYGTEAGYWLALQDVIEKCKAAGTTCIVNVGGAPGSPSVPVPTTPSQR
ncbi:MAG: hypothetical protein Q7T54_00185 [Candidatus Levybacteria bacterium]|nr:hypothetical protein [Candidatus Levybacteria bacterium]